MFSRISAVAIASLVLGGLMVTGSPAQAATLGDLTVSPGKGNDGSVVTLTTSGPCPREATNVLATIFGSGFATGQNLIGNSPLRIYPRTTDGGYIIPLQYTLGDTAKLQRVYKGLSGTYKVVVTCRGVIKPQDLGQFVGSVSFSNKIAQDGSRKYTAKNPATTPAPTAGASGTTKGSTQVQAQPTPQGLTPDGGSNQAVNGGDSSGSNGASSGLPLVLIVLAIALLAGSLALVRRSVRTHQR